MNRHEEFLKFNDREIVYVQEEGLVLIAIRPICEALNVVYTGQLKRLKSHPILGSALYKRTIKVGKSGQKQGRKMTCVPEKYVYGWIFSISSDKPELIEYQKTCYDLLYNHFHGIIGNRKKLLIERKSIDIKIAELEKKLKETDMEYKELNELKNQRKTVSTQLNSMDRQIVNQKEIFE